MQRPALLLLAPLALASAACGGGADTGRDDGAASPATDVAPAAAAGASDGPARPASFAMCASCHQVDPGRHGVGPSLAGVFGARAGHVEGYTYSKAMRESGLTWDEATLDRYLEAPMQAVPGTKMAYAGLKDPAKRKEMIEYLKGL